MLYIRKGELNKALHTIERGAAIALYELNRADDERIIQQKGLRYVELSELLAYVYLKLVLRLPSFERNIRSLFTLQ
jgi:hypothetical protein